MTRRILLYGDVNLNYLDGSGVWLVALAQCLHRTGSEVHVLLKADVQDPQRRAALDALNGLTVHTPFDDRPSGLAGMQPRLATSRIVTLDRRHRFDVVISRGFDIASHLATSGRFTNRMWPYLTEGAAFQFTVTDHQRHLLDAIGEQSRRIFLQTEEARSVVEGLNGAFTGKTLVMNPIVPDAAFRAQKPEGWAASGPLDMVYAGKFARLWNTLEMTSLPQRLSEEGLEATLTMVGDKFQKTGNDDEWLAAMKASAQAEDPRVNWTGGLPRTEVLDVVHRADVGLCWRDAELDQSPEISTKMLECSALGTPPVLNRTTMHENLFGADYPLFIDGGDVMATLRRAIAEPYLVERAREVARRAAAPYSMAATVERFEGYFARAEADPASIGALLLGERRRRVVVAGHDFKFAADLLETMRQRDDIELRIDKWQRLAVHDEKQSRRAAEWADTVICEWAGPNAVFYAKHLPAHARLIVRFHGFEIRGNWIKDLDPRRVDAFVFVSDFYRKQVLHTLGWPEHNTTVIPNTIDAADLDRPKLPGAQFHIGLAGYVPFLKRPDRAVDLLRLLLREDDRYHLHLRGRLPWQYQWEWRKPAGQDAYREFFRSVADDPQLRAHVIFEPFSPDMGNWFRRIGWMTSPSSRETFHLAPVEGMASGAPALVWDRDGATEIFGGEYVRSSTEELAEIVLAHREESAWQALGAASKQRVDQYDLMHARARWLDILQLERGQRPTLHGTSLLDAEAVPQDRAEALVALDRAFEAQGAEGAAAVQRQHPDLLEEEAALVTGWRRLEGWADGSSLPPRDVAPLYEPERDLVLVAGSGRVPDDAPIRTVQAVVPALPGEFSQDVLLLADALTRTGLRERVAAVAASGTLVAATAAALTARRLGVPLHCGDLAEPMHGSREGELLSMLRARLLDQSSPMAALRDGTPIPESRRLPAPTIDDLRIGLIADEFTARTISTAMPTVILSRSGWADQLDELDAVIVESAWEGRDHEWFHGIAYHGEDEAKDLWGLIAACRERRIPVLFWNKEDPVHFRSFALAAGRCEHVFTTDADRLPAYLAQPNQNLTATSMPFYAEPRMHNPLPSTREHSATAAFAGTFYGKRYKARSAELEMILDAAAQVGLTIYDRQKDRPESPYQFPARLQSFSVGSVPYEQVLQVYKAHPVNINVNSVNDSPSMFSRRVVEIAASGSVVASGAGRGVRESLGEAFPVMTTSEQWQDALRTWLGDEDARLRTVWGQMRTVLRTHRADQALTLMLRTAGVAVNPRPLPTCGWFAPDRAVVEAAALQTLPPVVITSDPDLAAVAAELGLRTASTPSAVDWVMHGATGLPATIAEDLLLATLFTDADVLSARRGGRQADPLITPGRGESELTMWRANLDAPENGRNPFTWRIPKDP